MSSNRVSEDQISVSFRNVTKRYYLLHQKTLKELLTALIQGKKTKNEFYALKKTSFEIKKGESVGIIGKNGSGKSTILKLVAGVTNPTSGQVRVYGKIAPLIELGAGFHPELSGKENIFLNGVILGMKRQEIQTKLQSIIDFSELQDFIDQPVKHYSSGMYLRLAFAVAVHTDPDILLVDEILAVGDAAFQKKCFIKLEEFKQRGVSIIFVSHSLDMVLDFCDRSIVLDEGMIVVDSKTKRSVATYKKIINKTGKE